MTDPRPNSTLLYLLTAGCRVTLPDGRYLQGDPETRYLTIGRDDASLGLYDLSAAGLTRALSDPDWRPTPQD